MVYNEGYLIIFNLIISVALLSAAVIIYRISRIRWYDVSWSYLSIALSFLGMGSVINLFVSISKFAVFVEYVFFLISLILLFKAVLIKLQ